MLSPKKSVRDSGCGSRFVFFSVILALPASSSGPSCNCIQRCHFYVFSLLSSIPFYFCVFDLFEFVPLCLNNPFP
ncbi:hypothetical protein S83_025604 [Arachis hypogaea]